MIEIRKYKEHTRIYTTLDSINPTSNSQIFSPGKIVPLTTKGL